MLILDESNIVLYSNGLGCKMHKSQLVLFHWKQCAGLTFSVKCDLIDWLIFNDLFTEYVSSYRKRNFSVNKSCKKSAFNQWSNLIDIDNKFMDWNCI